MGIFKNDKEFKQAIGAFIIAFSELEYGLVFLCSMTEFDVRRKDEYVVKYLGFTFDRKMQILTEFIEQNLTELKPTWEKLKIEIKTGNILIGLDKQLKVPYYIKNSKLKVFDDNISTQLILYGGDIKAYLNANS
jgi:hypothetical protein